MFERFITAFLTVQALDVFGISLGILIIGILCKYFIKLRKLTGSENRTEQRLIRNEIVAVGPQLCLVGLTTLFGISRLFIRIFFHKQQLMENLIGLYNGLIVAQIIFLLGTTAIMSWYDERYTVRGVVIPNILGFLSVGLSANLFYFIIFQKYL